MDIDINDLKLQPGDDLTPAKRRMMLTKRDSRTFDRIIK